MYKLAAEHINKGLSLIPRLILGSVAGLFGIVMLLFGIDGLMHNVSNWFGYIVTGMFCTLIALTCFTWGRVRQFIGSCIGVILFLLGFYYLIAELSGGILISGKRSEPSILNAIMFMMSFGIPGMAYTIKAKFGIHRQENN